MTIKTLIEKEEFQKLIAATLINERYKDILSSMSYDSIEFEQGFIQGLCWAAIFTTQCKSYYVEVENENKTS